MSWKYFGLLWLVAVLDSIRPTAAWFEQCSHNINLGVGGSMYVNSPGYSNRYPPGTSCRYIITAPLDYEINIQCSIAMDKGSTACSSEYFYVNTEGNTELQNSEYFCGNGYVQRKSTFRSIVIAYTSSSTSASTSGAFSCLVSVNPQECDCGWSTTSRIVGGTETQPNEYPMMAGLVNVATGSIFCGGTIISHRCVLTAAHCFLNLNNPSQIAVVVGEHDVRTGSDSPYTKIHLVQSIRRHESYNPSTNVNDIAIVATQTNIEWSRGVGPACLPFLYSFAPFDGIDVDILGWGTTTFGGPRSSVLRKAITTVASNTNCQNVIPTLQSSQMCTYAPGRDSCQFDSGGPGIRRFQRQHIILIISYGQACGADAPAVNTRVTSHLDWIQRNCGDTFCRKN